jgi:hypothetical protein
MSWSDCFTALPPGRLAVATGMAAIAVGAAVLAIFYPLALAGALVAGCWAAGMAEQAAAERRRNRNRPGKDKETPSREQTAAKHYMYYACMHNDQDTGSSRFQDRVSAEQPPGWDLY